MKFLRDTEPGSWVTIETFWAALYADMFFFVTKMVDWAAGAAGLSNFCEILIFLALSNAKTILFISEEACWAMGNASVGFKVTKVRFITF